MIYVCLATFYKAIQNNWKLEIISSSSPCLSLQIDGGQGAQSKILIILTVKSAPVSEHIIELIGNVDYKIVYFCLTTPIIHSTCMRTQDN